MIHNAIDNLEADGRLINLAGRQRMLSQAIMKNSLLASTNSLAQRDEQRQELTKVHRALKSGSDTLGLNKLPLDFSEDYLKVDQKFQLFMNALTQYEAAPTSENLDQTAEQQLDFLRQMNDFVFAYEDYNREKLMEFKKLELFLAIFAMLILFAELFFIFIPAINTLQKQNKKLELALFNQSHNIRHPITNIQLSLNLLRAKSMTAEDQELIDQALAESKVLDQQIRENNEHLSKAPTLR
ncbi:type IV pili methyl-accepting chemotaxis transducer N-terminal domain-containing protein [Croceiramulus getboli]|nr:type IV pili methyl-accepting chemotaxis transducer N-terminal domain-containing protein [Flavobacteriaceae bacterium YJPT1-3]